MPSTLAYLFGAAPKLAARAKAGQLAGEQEREQADRLDTARRDEMMRRALEQSILQGERDRTFGELQRSHADTLATQRAAQDAAARRAEEDRTAREAEAERQRQFLGGENEKNRANARTIAGMPARASMGQGGGKTLPAGQAENVGAARGMLSLIDRASQLFGALPKGANPTGAIVGRLTGVKNALGLQRPDEIEAQQALSNINTTLLNLRSGAAVSDAEYARLAPLIPEQKEDEQTIRTKLANLRRELEIILDEKVNVFEDTGYDVGRLRRRAGASAPVAPASPAATTDPDEALVDAFLSSRRKP